MSAILAWTAAWPRWTTSIRPALVLGPLLVAHFAVVAGVALTAERAGWRFGAETPDWAAARALGHLDLSTTVGYGAPALLWPFALADGLPLAVVLQVAIGGPLLLLFVYGIGTRIGGRLLGYVAALGWVVAPLLALGFFYGDERTFQGVPYDDFRGLVHDTVLPNALGLAVGPAYPALVAVAAAAWLVVRSLDTTAWNDVLLAGLVSGFAIGIQPLNALFLPAPLVALLVTRRPRQALGFAAALAPAIATLALWRSGAPMDLLRSFDFGRYEFWANRVHFRGAGWSYLLVGWIAVAGSFAVVRRSPRKGLLVALWFAGFFVVGSGSLSGGRVLDGSLFAVIEPAYPAFVLLAAALVLLVPPLGRRSASPSRPERAPRPTRTLVAATVGLALYPLALVAAAQLA